MSRVLRGSGLPRMVAIGFGVAVVALAALGARLLQLERAQHREAVEAQLWSIAQLKARQVSSWRQARVDDAWVLMAQEPIRQSARRFLESGVPDARDSLREGLAPFHQRYHYADILLLDTQGRTRLCLHDELHLLAEEQLGAFTAAVAERRPAWTSLHRREEAGLDVGVVAPLIEEETTEAVGALVLLVDVFERLYPSLDAWPVPRRTAETFLVRRSGSDVLFLDDLRYQSAAPLTLRISVKRPELPSAMAVRGRQGIVYGTDYRGAEVVAALLPIADSPWFLVAKLDSTEAFAELRKHSYLVVLLTLGALGLVGAIGLFVWQRNLNAYYRSLYASEAALRGAEERYRLLLDNAGVFVALCDRNGKILLVNRELAQAMRGEPEQFVGRYLPEITKPELAHEWTRRLHEVIDSGEPREYKDTVWFPGGEREVLSELQPARNSEGEIFAAQFVAHDVTELHRLERQLAQSQKMEAIGRLAGGIAHDFNNLLAVIISYAEFSLQALPESDPIHADIHQILLAGQRAAGLTRQLLAFGRRQILEPRILDLNQVVKGLQEMLERLLGEDIDLRFKTDPGLDRVHADPTQIEQVILNLIVNSRDAMPEGGSLTIETANTELDEEYANEHAGFEPGAYVMLAVTDTGSGMDEKTRQRIFEPFFTTKGETLGTGLGLSTVYGIVKQSGGSIWVYSERGHGTTFKIYLPRATEGQVEERSAAASSAEDSSLEGDETILVVEDEGAVRKLVRRILATAGYRVLGASNADEAILECEEHQGEIGLVLTDVVLPSVSGRMLVRRLQEISPGLRALYMSGYTENAIAHHGILDEGTAFLAKPFAAKELLRKVRAELDKDRPPAATG